MTADLLITFIGYAFVTSITPGPNNTMLLASGVNFGFRPSLPHILGITLGFTLMVLAVGLGLGAVFQIVPVLHSILRFLGAAYLLYLAWRIAGTGAPDDGTAGTTRPLSVMQAAAFQWVNPKAWIMAIGAVATYAPQADYAVNIGVLTVLFALVNGPCVAVWAAAGTSLRRFLTNPRKRRRFNIGMAVLLAASILPILSGH
ncbi:LysE family translocator [Azospirillum picis]|uniref:Threonine/homoserine/homoserine lactone efflux protein n=1 Tax=Azospirillum picis TaxID=488438 RepID=A0ABU0MQJ8_9PROT|nr:LysE family translocator [Azospirillum picis]MBP2302169.1 threonine/homoserine/homoserine lactone efflux protein [Azospirillum picis]MDQ0535748.1 threonine/homoserine/homoserine lactone efflux protein [Azospirillum picis]